MLYVLLLVCGALPEKPDRLESSHLSGREWVCRWAGLRGTMRFHADGVYEHETSGGVSYSGRWEVRDGNLYLTKERSRFSGSLSNNWKVSATIYWREWEENRMIRGDCLDTDSDPEYPYVRSFRLYNPRLMRTP